MNIKTATRLRGAASGLLALVLCAAGIANATAASAHGRHADGFRHHQGNTVCAPKVKQRTNTGDSTLTLQSNGVTRSAQIHVPATYRSASALPVILVFHGRGSTGSLTRDFSGLTRLPAITVFAEGLPTDDKQSWQGASYAAKGVDDVKFVDDLLDTVERQYCVDSRRIFATGKSNGGGFVSLLACTRSARIAAFAPVAGAYYPGTAQGWDTAPGAPILAFHGTGDATMKYAGGTSHGDTYPSVPTWLDTWAERNGCESSTSAEFAPDATKTTWHGCNGRNDLEHIAITDGGHTWPGADAYSGGGYASTYVEATDVMWEFFRKHPLPAGHRCWH